MLLHIVPRMLAYRESEPECSLIDVTIPELGLVLRAGDQVAARRPYPNKNYLVACKAAGQRAWNGILVETRQPVREFTVTSRWGVGEDRVVSHQVRCTILDDEHDTASWSAALWYGDARAGFANRWPAGCHFSPMLVQPRMDLVSRERAGGCEDQLESDGVSLVARTEEFRVPTIEPERLLSLESQLKRRIPPRDDAFLAAV